jgi:retron-type reverse transcriptase
MTEISLSFRGGGHIIENLFHNIVSIPNLLKAWKEFKRGKRNKKGVGDFEMCLEENIFELHEDLISKKYQHSEYADFYISDPKRRHIHKASVRDRVVHQAIFQILYPVFDKHFIYDSYSSRKSRGTHLGVQRTYRACRKVSKNWKIKTYVLKCDVRKFFDSIDHSILRNLILKKMDCDETMRLVGILFKSFEKEKEKGLPLGNVTSQLFSNIYLNELDQFAKHDLKLKYYFRYCDDFVIIHENKDFLLEIMEKIRNFLRENLELDLHPKKVEIRPLRRGIDFLGYVILPHMVVLRTRTRWRIIRKIKMMRKKLETDLISEEKFKSVLNSYFGVVSHCRARKTEAFIKRFL